MESLVIKETDNTPSIVFDIKKHNFEMKGSSHPENPLKFFNPIVEWLEEYAKNPGQNVVMSFNLEYFNSSTAKYILNILWTLEKMSKAHPSINVVINWFYKEEDLDAYAAGERYTQLTTLKVNLIKD